MRPALATRKRTEILRRIAAGDPLTMIAADIGYADHSGIIHMLETDPDYKRALAIGVTKKIEKRERELEQADSNFTVTRADRLLGHARWWAGVWHRERYGEKPQLEVTLDLGVALQRILERRGERAVADLPNAAPLIADSGIPSDKKGQ